MIDITKQYQTRDGRKVRILCTDGPGNYPVIGLLGGRKIKEINKCRVHQPSP